MKAVIDRIEGTLAVLLISDDEELSFNIPVSYLPAGVKEGDHLTISFQLDKASRAAAEQRTKELLKELTKNNDPSEKKFKL